MALSQTFDLSLGLVSIVLLLLLIIALVILCHLLWRCLRMRLSSSWSRILGCPEEETEEYMIPHLHPDGSSPDETRLEMWVNEPTVSPSIPRGKGAVQRDEAVKDRLSPFVYIKEEDGRNCNSV